MDQIVLVLASREEYIFQLQLVEAQISYMSQPDKLKLLQNIQFKILKVEQRRIQIEAHTLLVFADTRKMLQKLVKKFIKIQLFYYQKLQLYFPLFSQRKQFLPTQRNQLFKLANNPQKDISEIIQVLLSLQKERLYRKIDSLIKAVTKNDSQTQCDQISNKNEKFCQDPIITLDSLNHVHLTYYLQNRQQSNCDPYDILGLDDQSKESLFGGGFKSYVSCLTKTKNVFIPIEATQEILLFRYEKLTKQFQDMNIALGKRILKFYKSQQKVTPSITHKETTVSLHVKPNKQKRNQLLKLRLSKQEAETRASCTFHDGYLTDKEPYYVEFPEFKPLIFKSLKTVLKSSNNLETRQSVDGDKIKQKMYTNGQLEAPLVLCGKSLLVPEIEEKKRRIYSNNNEKSNIQSQAMITKSIKLSKLQLANRYCLVQIKQHCSQLKISQT